MTSGDVQKLLVKIDVEKNEMISQIGIETPY